MGETDNKSHVVRNHKDTVFRMLFRNRTKLLELYNALNGTHYEDPGEMETCTLENAIYMSFKNDVAFLIGSEMNLYEHQGYFNPNMPLRDLIYVARELEKYMAGDTLYSSRQVKIPVPRFVVFYNGTAKHPDAQGIHGDCGSGGSGSHGMYSKRYFGGLFDITESGRCA